MICVDVQRIGASRPGKPLFTDLSLTVATGDRIGIVGLNGTGKSTLLRVLGGIDRPEIGEVHFGSGVRIAVLDQRAELADGTARTIVGDNWEAAAVLDRLGVTSYADRPVETLSGGQRKRIALAKALLTESDLLVLDEPTNHLDVDAIEYLEDRLARFRGALLLVTHDRHVLDRLTTKVLELDRGTGYLHVPAGPNAGSGYAAYLEARAAREEQAVAAEKTRKNLARSELAWLRRGAPARTSKPKARIEAAKELIEGRMQAAARSGDLDLSSLGTSRLGTKVVELEGVGHRFDDQAWLFRGLDLLVEPGDRLGIVGPNGAGKSTLLEIIAGRITPAEGTVERGATVNLGYHDQLGVQLDPDMRVRDAVAGPLRPATWEDDRLLERFWFNDDARYAPIGLLSGGERRRLQLVMTLSAQPNVLLLDEPTNDLDLDTLRALEEFLDDWPGALVTVSHDRAFMERVVEHVVAIEDGTAGLVRGGMAGWLEQRRRGVSTKVAPNSKVAASKVPASKVPPGAKVPADPAVTAKAPSAPDAPVRRSDYTLGRLIRDAEKDMERIGRKRDQLHDQLVATTDHVELTRLGKELAVAEAALAEAEETWLALAEERER
ncbi:MAG: ABC-F family ATP-binding cassette domain-containing protein [Acidimicrobiia bacterium]